MSVDRIVAPEVAEAIAREQTQETYAAVGPWLEVHFAAAATTRDVQHGLDVVPTGYELLLEVGGYVRATNIMDWTTELAFLQADNANTRARLRFVLLREDLTHA
jgi:hypothetical protein